MSQTEGSSIDPREPAVVPLPRLYERDIDVLLREELLFSPAVQELVLTALKLPQAATFERCSLSVVDDTGETDIHADLAVDGQRISLLIENKIDAAFQPRQPERYRERATAMGSGTAFCLLVAPKSYGARESAQFSFFDAVISYEEIASAMAAENTRRAVDRSDLLLRAVSQARTAYTLVPSQIVGSFWERVYEIAFSEFPELGMKAPGPKGSNSSWIILKADLPARITIDWKAEKGTIGLSFWKNAVVMPEASTDLSLIGSPARMRIAGTTTMIEIVDPSPDDGAWAEMSADRIRAWLSRAHDLLTFYRRELHSAR